MNTSSFERELREHGRLVYSCTGTSMLPMLRQARDLVIIEPAKGRLKPLDVALYRRGERYILHRVIEVRAEDYVICGDNCTEKEYGIRDENILGVLTGFVRGGKTYSVDGGLYRLYAHLIRDALPLRRGWRRLRARIARRLPRRMKNAIKRLLKMKSPQPKG